jgi:hypothetical protein
MTTELIKKFNKMFSEGQLPEEFDFSIKPTEEIDWSKVKYNTFYKEPDFFINRFPSGFRDLPGFDKIIDKMVDNSLTPLEEMELRSEIKNEEINNIDNIVEADNAEQESVFKFDE